MSPYYPFLLYSAAAALTAGLVSFTLFFFSLREKSSLHKSIFQQWALAFFLISWDKLPTAFMAAGFAIPIKMMGFIYLLIGLATSVGMILLYCGMAGFFTLRKFWLNVFPVYLLLFLFLSSALLYIVFNQIQATFIVIKVFRIGIALFMLGGAISFFFEKETHFSKAPAKFGLTLFVLGWLVYLIFRVYLWQQLDLYPVELWDRVLLTREVEQAGISFAHILFVISLVLISKYHKHDAHLKHDRNLLIGGIASAAGFLTIIFVIVHSSLTTAETRAGIYLKPTDDNFVVLGKEFNVSVYVNSKPEFNAVEANLNFPAEFLEAEEISKENSAIGFWINKPSFSNVSGTIEMSGIIPGGKSGEAKIAEIKFRALKIGAADINFYSASVLANDGKGTEILENKEGITYYIRPMNSPTPDLDRSGSVDLRDLSILIFYWNAKNRPEYDLNGDNLVDLKDISILISSFGKK